jgi:hypothetical protein
VTDADEHLRYPVGPLQRIREPLNHATRLAHVRIIEQAPTRLAETVGGASVTDLDRGYRPGGWTARQVVHHIADSHMNSYVRMKLAATEDRPVVKSYDETLWAELTDARTAPVEVSLALIDALHRRWVAFLLALHDSELRRCFRHYQWGEVSIEESITMYSWHCRHHIAHVALALNKPVETRW